MRRLYLSQAAGKACATAGATILVGQRCLLSTPSAGPAPFTAIVVAECVPCEDPSVVAEQVECLERILPFGIEIVGVCGCATEVAGLISQLGDSTSKEWVAVVSGNGQGSSLSCHLLDTPTSKVEIAEVEATFVEVRVALHSCEHDLPLLFSSHGGSPVLVDGESGAPLRDVVPAIMDGAQCVQLGAASSTLRIHVVLAPSFVSAKGVYATLRRQINAAITAGTTRLVEVQSHNTHISYCCRVEPGAASPDAELSAQALEEVFEMIEDATGAAAKQSDMKGSTSVVANAKATTQGSVAAAAPKRKARSDSLMLLLGIAVVVLAIIVVLMR